MISSEFCDAVRARQELDQATKERAAAELSARESHENCWCHAVKTKCKQLEKDAQAVGKAALEMGLAQDIGIYRNITSSRGLLTRLSSPPMARLVIAGWRLQSEERSWYEEVPTYWPRGDVTGEWHSATDGVLLGSDGVMRTFTYEGSNQGRSIVGASLGSVDEAIWSRGSGSYKALGFGRAATAAEATRMATEHLLSVYNSYLITFVVNNPGLNCALEIG